jgi:hypothetical protein
MKLTAHFFLLNDHFSPEYAEANHGGKESENNPLYEWEDEMEVSQGLKEIEVLRNGVFNLIGEMPDGSPFDCPVEKMFLLALKMENVQIGYFGVSESILDSFTLEGDDNIQVLKVYIKDYEPLANPMPGVFIASKEFPKALIF